jgi:hypothetical protein
MKPYLATLFLLTIFSAATLAKKEKHDDCGPNGTRCVNDGQPKLQSCSSKGDWQNTKFCKVCTGGEDYPECEEY